MKKTASRPPQAKPRGTPRPAAIARPARTERAPVAPAPSRARTTEFRLTGDHIALDNLLKITGVAPSGGAAKAMAANREVKVDGVIELRKTCKIRTGQLVEAAGVRIRVLAAETQADK